MNKERKRKDRNTNLTNQIHESATKERKDKERTNYNLPNQIHESATRKRKEREKTEILI